jgi:hypothetical protein
MRLSASMFAVWHLLSCSQITHIWSSLLSSSEARDRNSPIKAHQSSLAEISHQTAASSDSASFVSGSGFRQGQGLSGSSRPLGVPSST